MLPSHEIGDDGDAPEAGERERVDGSSGRSYVFTGISDTWREAPMYWYD